MICTLPLAFGLALATLVAGAQVNLGTAAPFGVIAASTITNTGLTVVKGQLGLYPGTSITGFPPGKSGAISAANPKAQKAQADAHAAYNEAMAATCTKVLTGLDLGGLKLKKGVYCFSSSAQLTGTLTLDGAGDPSSTWIFKMGSTITTAPSASVVVINGGKTCNVFWQVGSSATLDTGTKFAGTVIALASITANSGVTSEGGLFALTAAVTLIDDAITAPSFCAPTTVRCLPPNLSRLSIAYLTVRK